MLPFLIMQLIEVNRVHWWVTAGVSCFCLRSRTAVKEVLPFELRTMHDYEKDVLHRKCQVEY